MTQYLDIAIEAAKAAGRIHLKYFDTDLKIKTKQGESHNRVTIADTESEKKIVSMIKKHFPGHNFLGEENKYEKTDSEFTWIIDPLDGTNNYSHSFPIFCVSIALAKKGEIILGIVYDPLRNELFTAEKGKGAYLNNKRIKVTDNTDLKECILITGFYYDRGERLIRTLEDIRTFFSKLILGMRRTGSAALDLCYVASGRVDGFWEFLLNPWDFAAGKLIIEEAGGKATDKGGNKLLIKPSYVVASNGRIHDKMLEILK
ncbi:MAG: inositol monophosphatase [Nanoarchaeota archaeon]|nr:inositol monophosphatase [Nanoarchaeota archaeon]